MIRRGEKPTRIHNNCSGKHTGFLALARHWDIATEGYEHHDHPVQQAVAKALSELSGIDDFAWGIDGCAAPNFALPLSAFARALAKTCPNVRSARASCSAMIAHPELVSGTGRACATLMRAANGRAAVKTGAEGVYAAMIPERGLGIALKIDDGAGRAAETAIAAMLDKLGLLARGDHALISAPDAPTRAAKRSASAARRRAGLSMPRL